MSNELKQIHGFLRRTRRSLAFRALLNGLSAVFMVWIPLCFVVLLGASFLADAAIVRLSSLVFGVGIALGVLVYYVLVPLWRWRDDRRIARHVEQRVPELRNNLVSSLEFSSGVDRRLGFSDALIVELHRQTASSLGRLRPADLARDRLFTEHLQLAGLFLLASTFFFLTVPSVLNQGLSNLFERTSFGSLGAIPARKQSDTVVGDIRLRYVYPHYTGLKVKEIVGTHGDISAIRGTRVHFETRSLFPVKKAMLLFSSNPKKEIPLKVDGRMIRGSISVENRDGYRFRILRPDSVAIDETASRSIEMEKDGAPEVEFVKMPLEIELNPGDRLPLRFVAVDDYGLSRIDLVAEVRGKKHKKKLIEFKKHPRLYRSQNEALILADLEVERGDRIRYWLEVRDNDEISGYKMTKSAVLLIKIHSPREKHLQLIKDQVALMEKMIDLLGDRLESPIDRRSLKTYDRSRGAQTRISKKSDALEQQLKKLLRGLQKDPLTRPDIVQEYTAIANALTRLNTDERKVLKAIILRSGNQKNLSDLNRLHRVNEIQIAALEKNIPFIENLIGRQRRESVLSNVNELLSRQNRLMKLIEKLKKTKDKKLATEIQKRVADLQRRLQKILQQMNRPTSILPDERYNRTAFKPRKNLDNLSRFQDKLSRIKKLLARGKYDEAMNLANSMQHDLQNIKAAMNRDFKRFQNEKFAAVYNGLKKSVRQLDRLQRQQERIRKQTGKVSEQYSKQLRRLLRKKFKKFLRKELSKVSRLRRKLKRVSGNNMHSTDKEMLENLKRRASHLRDVLKRMDMKEALKLAEETRQGIKKLARELQTQLQYRSKLRRSSRKRYSLRAAKKRLDRSMPLAKEIADDIKALLGGQRRLLSKRDQKRLERLGKKQAQLTKRLEKTYEKLRKLGRDYPIITKKIQQMMKGVRKSMDNARRRLGEKSPLQAEFHEKSVVKRLKQLQKGLEKTFRKNPKQQVGRVTPGIDKVRIPTPEDYRPPKRFTEAVLKAYREREKAPQRYQEMIKRYYEAILRRKIQ